MTFAAIERHNEATAEAAHHEAGDAREAVEMDAACMVRYVSAPVLGQLINEHGDGKIVDLLFAALRDAQRGTLPFEVQFAFDSLIEGVTECLADDLARYEK